MKEKYIDDLQEIRSSIERSTKFLSISNKAGIVAGLFALIGAYIAYQQIYYSDTANPGYGLYFWVLDLVYYTLSMVQSCISNTIDTNF